MGQFSLDRRANDTSITLDLLRAAAAQAVCVGHAINFGSGATITLAPVVGVLVFFVLSGFVIAHTLTTKSVDPRYGLIEFGIERFARIYSAFFPAVVFIAVVDHLDNRSISENATDWQTFLGNLTMRQGLPSSWGVPTFGSAGHLTSIAVEFHIYFFVGALFFLVKGKNRLLCIAVAFLFSTMPLAYFDNIAGSDRSLFVLWLFGFAAYFVAREFQVFPNTVPFAGSACAILVWYWAAHRTTNDYDQRNYPAFAAAFLAVVVFSQLTSALARQPVVVKTVRFFADYSFSLFLIHLTIIKSILVHFPGPALFRIAIGIIVANLASAVFASFTEAHYRSFGDLLKYLFVRKSPANVTH